MTVALAERYRDRLPVTDETPLVTLGEGSTPLIPAPRLSEELDIELWLKWEGANPTGSFKDRGMTVAVSKALEEGFGAVVCASTGNTAASAAAYAARAAIGAVILQPAGAVARGKITQAQAVGARVLAVQGPFEAALDAARELGRRGTHALVNSLNPYRLEGQKTAAFEIVVGEASSRAYTMATAIRIAEPAHRELADEAIGRSGGTTVSLADDELIGAWRDLAEREGVFCEPSSAAGIAALRRERPEAGSLVVCVVTGHGLKDPDAAGRLSAPPIPVPADMDAIAEAASP